MAFKSWLKRPPLPQRPGSGQGRGPGAGGCRRWAGGPAGRAPPSSPVGPGKAVPRLQRFQFELLGMNHPPFPPPVLLSGLLHPRPQWPASRTEQHRPSTSGRPSLGRLASALPDLWPKNCSRAGFRAGIRAKAPGRRPCYPTHSPSAPPKLKARHPIPPPTGVRKAQGLAQSRRVYCVQSLIFTDGNCGPERQRSLPGSHEEGAPPGPDAGPADPSPRFALPRTATGESWEEARAVSKSSLSVEPSSRPLTAEVTTAPQAGAGAPAPTPERSPGALRVPVRREAEACGEMGTHIETPRLWRAWVHAGDLRREKLGATV
ncbi:protein enabled homolog [Mustela lutreola]|uniref:protein enabled homolog n=1 Tax=Mustela lutreola TaxID=9666 RepID=UPI00279761E9|nr:protein enabled homolog [Mustela lutreola]XP_058992894.1 protein enabled homolog [Mustela lutreola]